MAISAKEMNKPFYVVAESIKFARLYPLNQHDLSDKFKVLFCWSLTIFKGTRGGGGLKVFWVYLPSQFNCFSNLHTYFVLPSGTPPPPLLHILNYLIPPYSNITNDLPVPSQHL